ncbi:MAG: shikimate dehydrogenase, partial [Candidatus Omnitrophica bacterium]|nr:shikimate dehydrogenase [Candidatus Omnitrophota bacterium]
YRPRRISIYDINLATAIALVGRLKSNFKYTEFRVARSVKELGIQNSDLLINATPLGMKEEDPCIVNQDYLHRNLLVYDLIYNPAQTKLLRLARDKGCSVCNGLGMLLYQGALSFEIWTGKKAPLEIMRQALTKNIQTNDY